MTFGGLKWLLRCVANLTDIYGYKHNTTKTRTQRSNSGPIRTYKFNYDEFEEDDEEEEPVKMPALTCGSQLSYPNVPGIKREPSPGWWVILFFKFLFVFKIYKCLICVCFYKKQTILNYKKNKQKKCTYK